VDLWTTQRSVAHKLHNASSSSKRKRTNDVLSKPDKSECYRQTSCIVQIVIRRKGQAIHREAQTFDRKQAAKPWLSRRETELAQPGALDRREDPTLGAVIDR
jgi:hypothetical protein